MLSEFGGTKTLVENKWRTKEIDRTFSQTHAVCVADINGDGLLDFVTGKRWHAHSGGDPGAKRPICDALV